MPRTASRPSSVIFDVGNVLVDWQPELLYRSLIPNAMTRARFLGKVATKTWHFQHDAGRPFAETRAELTAEHPQFAEAIAAWGPRFSEQVAPMPGMTDVVDALDARGVPLYAITNFSHEFWPPFAADHAHIFDRFAGIVVSGAERLVKPDAAIYRLALARFGLTAGEALFVDDREDNIAGAAAVGLFTHLFTGVAPLRAALLDYGLLDADMAITPRQERSA